MVLNENIDSLVNRIISDYPDAETKEKVRVDMMILYNMVTKQYDKALGVYLNVLENGGINEMNG